MEWRVTLWPPPAADQIVGPDDLFAPALVEGHGDAGAVSRDRRRLDAVLDLNALPRQMVAQHALGAPLGLAALEFVFAAEARELDEPEARLPRTQKLDLFDARAVGEKGLDHASPVEHFEHRRLKARPARFVMRRRPLFDDPGLDAVTEKLACGEKARGPRADDEHLGSGRFVSGPRRHISFPPSLPRL